MLPFNPPKSIFPLSKKNQGDNQENTQNQSKNKKDNKKKNYSLKVVDKKLKLVLPPIPKKTIIEPKEAKSSSFNFISEIKTFFQNLIKK